jgi:hypothetical protein
LNSNFQSYRLQRVAENNLTGKLRLFVAIPVPAAIRDEMVRVQHELQPLAPRGVVRWTKPEQLHLTLRFLGDVSSDRVAGLQESLRTACSGTTPLPLYAQGVGFFPTARSPTSFGLVSPTAKIGWWISKGKSRMRFNRFRQGRPGNGSPGTSPWGDSSSLSGLTSSH